MCVCVSMNRLTPLVKSRRCYEKESKAPSSETVKQLWKAGTQKKYLFFLLSSPGFALLHF